MAQPPNYPQLDSDYPSKPSAPPCGAPGPYGPTPGSQPPYCPPGYAPPPTGYGPPPPGYAPPPAGYGQPPSACPPPPAYPQGSPKPKKSGGLSGIFNDVAKGVESMARDVTGTAGKLYHGDIMNRLTSGTVIQLYYKRTGKTIQIVQHPNQNMLLVDVLGLLSPQAYNAHWIVHREVGSVIKLYNQDNYLGVNDGQVVLFKSSNPTVAPPQTRWRVVQSSGSSDISLQSMHDVNGYLSTTSFEGSTLTLEKSTCLSERVYFTIQHVGRIGQR